MAATATATRKKTTSKKTQAKELTPPPSKADVQRARGKEPDGVPTVGRLDKDGKTKEVVVNIPKLEEQILDIVLIGDSPLVTHAWDQKAIRQILQTHMEGKKKTKKEKEASREPKNPFKDMLGSLYYDRTGHICFRSVAFKKAMIAACRYVPGVSMVHMTGCVRVLSEFTPLLGWPMNRLDMVNIGQGKDRTVDVRFRAEFEEWATLLRISYVKNIIKPEHVINLLSWAGKTVGVGEWRTEKSGMFGAFHVATEAEAKSVSKKLDQHNIKELTEKNTGTLEVLAKLQLHLEVAA